MLLFYPFFCSLAVQCPTLQLGKIIYTITFDSGEGSAVAELKVEEGKTATQPTDPTRTGYAFQHWSTSEGGEEAFDFNREITTDITLYAKWEAETHTVTFVRIGDLGPDKPLGTKEVASGTALAPSIFDIPPYELASLYADEQGMQVFDRTTVIETDRTLYVKWVACPKK